MTLLIPILLCTTLLIDNTTHNIGDITYIAITYNINQCNVTYMFLSTVLSKVIYK
jgi:hypothetical protein